MISELVVDVQPKEVSIAVLEDKSLVELQREARNVSFSVGDIYLGKVKKIMPGLNAAFIDVGYKKDAFLHYLDLGPNFNTQQKFLKQALDEQKGEKKSILGIREELWMLRQNVTGRMGNLSLPE